MPRSLLPVVLGSAALILASCAGVRFEQDWSKAVAAYESGDCKSPVTGPWTGTWLSKNNGHSGDLRCLITSLERAACDKAHSDKADGDKAGTPYEFRYQATWGKALSGGYTAQYDVVPDGPGRYRVSGEKKLGLFGKFLHKGKIEGDTFESTYTSEMGDHGVFELQRP